jgi:cell division protein FtsX
MKWLMVLAVLLAIPSLCFGVTESAQTCANRVQPPP